MTAQAINRSDVTELARALGLTPADTTSVRQLWRECLVRARDLNRLPQGSPYSAHPIVRAWCRIAIDTALQTLVDCPTPAPASQQEMFRSYLSAVVRVAARMTDAEADALRRKIDPEGTKQLDLMRQRCAAGEHDRGSNGACLWCDVPAELAAATVIASWCCPGVAAKPAKEAT